jgi:hypothetical protein
MMEIYLILQQIVQVVLIVYFAVLVGIGHTKYITDSSVIDLTVCNGLERDGTYHPK